MIKVHRHEYGKVHNRNLLHTHTALSHFLLHSSLLAIFIFSSQVYCSFPFSLTFLLTPANIYIFFTSFLICSFPRIFSYSSSSSSSSSPSSSSSSSSSSIYFLQLFLLFILLLFLFLIFILHVFLFILFPTPFSPSHSPLPLHCPLLVLFLLLLLLTFLLYCLLLVLFLLPLFLIVVLLVTSFVFPQIATSGFVSEEKVVEIEQFFKDNPVPVADRTIKQNCEAIRLNVRWLARDSAAIESWLKVL